VNDSDLGTLTLVDTAMESGAGVAIKTGQTAETGVAPVIVVPPASQTNYLGGTVKLTVTAAGFPAATFQWKRGVVGSGVYTNIPGGTGVTDGAINTLTLQNVTPANIADYVVVASNTSGSTTSSAPATLTLLLSSDSPATLVHRYSFQDPAGSSTFADSVGGSAWDGSLSGSATLSGSSLQLDGTAACYALLPSGITGNYNQITVEFWADIGSNPVWTRVFSFGDGSGGTKNSGLDYCPFAGGNYQNLDLYTTSHVDTYVNNPAGLNGTTGNHVTVIVDSVNGAMCYYNGTNVLTTLSSTVPALANINDIDNWIGASFVASDPYLAGTIYEFRIYQGILPPQAIALNDVTGPANYVQLSISLPALKASASGTNIVLSWPTNNINFAVQSSSSLLPGSGTSWSTLTNTPVVVGTNWQVSLPAAGAAKFYQLALH